MRREWRLADAGAGRVEWRLPGLIFFAMIKPRLQRRLWKHHLPLLLISFASVAGFYSTRDSKDVIGNASFATAYPAFALLAVTLLLGPWNLIRRRTNPISSDLRRDIGIWAAILCIVHTVVGQCVHLRGRPWLYYVYGPQEHHRGVRHDVFGLANYTGAVSTLVLIALFATSNDWSLRKLHTRTWKQAAALELRGVLDGGCARVCVPGRRREAEGPVHHDCCGLRRDRAGVAVGRSCDDEATCARADEAIRVRGCKTTAQGLKPAFIGYLRHD